jgi:formate hydrogenlyase subunit 6/NADH:ubiquinone oxidoreductase subunit I
MVEPSLACLEPPGADALFDALHDGGYEILGPTVRDHAIVYETLLSSSELPRGMGDAQASGRYELIERGDSALFGYAASPHSWKRYLHPSSITLLTARRTSDGLSFEGNRDAPTRRAFFGVRPCELAAIAAQDRVLMGGPHVDPVYAERRRSCLLIAVNCTHPASTCFCASLGTGPRARSGFDLALTELPESEREAPRLLVEIGSPRGAAIVEKLKHRPASEAEREMAEQVLSNAASRMERRLETAGLKERLYAHFEDPAWDTIGQRCLACANCTLVCPTCFCTTVVDTTSLAAGPDAAQSAERRRVWDSCFTLDFSYIHGGSVRTSAGARYRQWLTHKLATWQDQFGALGCVGCGRCIAWCPARIDLTAEANALGASPATGR